MAEQLVECVPNFSEGRRARVIEAIVEPYPFRPSAKRFNGDVRFPYERNPLCRVLELIRMEADRWGVSVTETEVYGMVPAAAMLESLAYYMQLAGFSPDQVLELRLLRSLAEQDE